MHNEQIFIKLSRRNTTNLYLNCMNTEVHKQIQTCCRIKKPTSPKISIKSMLKRNQIGSQSCALLSQGNNTQINEQIHHENLEKLDNFSCAKQSSCYMNYDRGYIRTNSMQEGYKIPKEIRISYNNQLQPNLNNYYEVPIKSENIENKIRQSKKGVGFNEFLSFGPKNFQIFRNINSLQINHVESDIIEQTERTEKVERQKVQVKRLTKTCSQIQIERQIGKFSTSALYNENLSRQFKTSHLFTSIKHAQTMKNGISSDHQSEVVQNFDSLIEKVKLNRLENWSITS